MSKEVVIIGAGEFARIAYEYFTYDSDYTVLAFSVHAAYRDAASLCGVPIIDYETLDTHFPPGSVDLFVGIPASDMNRTRTRFYLELKARGHAFARYVSSHAFVWRNAAIGENSFIFENNVIQPFVSVGSNCILWSGNHIGHRTVIHDHCFLSSHVVVSGYCEIGAGAFLGVNATLNDHIRVGEHALIGSGSLLVKDAQPQTIYVGSPARPVSGKSSFDAGI